MGSPTRIIHVALVCASIGEALSFAKGNLAEIKKRGAVQVQRESKPAKHISLTRREARHYHEVPQKHLTCKAVADTSSLGCDTYVQAAIRFLEGDEEAKTFVGNHIEMELEDAAYRNKELPDMQAMDNAPKLRPALRSRIALAQSMFALRHAWVALSGLDAEEATTKRDSLKKLYMKIPKDFVISRGDKPEQVEQRLKVARKLKKALLSADSLWLLKQARKCALPDELLNEVSEPFPQQSRIYPKGPLTKDSVIALSSPDGTVPQNGQRMPLLTLGTGYNDCYQGHAVRPREDGKLAKQTGELCEHQPIKGFYKHAVEAVGLKAIDTAFMYDTEQQIGNELASSDMFITTKTVPPRYREMLQLKHGTDKVKEQLHALQRVSVNVLYNHHDDQEQPEWRQLEKQVDSGHARALGSSDLDDAIHHEKCVARGDCKHHVSVIQETLSPCLATSAKIRRHIHRASALLGNTTIVAHSAVQGCTGEPVIADLAKKLGTSVPVVAIRATLQQGLPVVVQSRRTQHLKENLGAFDLNLSQHDLRQLALIPKIYSLNDELFEQ